MCDNLCREILWKLPCNKLSNTSLNKIIIIIIIKLLFRVRTDRREGSVEPAEPHIFGSVSGSEIPFLPSYISICIAEPSLTKPRQVTLRGVHFTICRKREMLHVAFEWSGNPFCKNRFRSLQMIQFECPRVNRPLVLFIFGVHLWVSISQDAGKGKCCMSPVN